MVKMLFLINRLLPLNSMLPVYYHLYVGYSPENLFFLEDQVNQGDQEDPKSER